jgi:hypothetical protein
MDTLVRPALNRSNVQEYSGRHVPDGTDCEEMG